MHGGICHAGLLGNKLSPIDPACLDARGEEIRSSGASPSLWGLLLSALAHSDNNDKTMTAKSALPSFNRHREVCVWPLGASAWLRPAAHPERGAHRGQTGAGVCDLVLCGVGVGGRSSSCGGGQQGLVGDFLFSLEPGGGRVDGSTGLPPPGGGTPRSLWVHGVLAILDPFF